MGKIIEPIKKDCKSEEIPANIITKQPQIPKSLMYYYIRKRNIAVIKRIEIALGYPEGTLVDTIYHDE